MKWKLSTKIKVKIKSERGSHLVRNGQVLTVLSYVFPDEDVVVLKENVQQLINTVQAFLPHVSLKKNNKLKTQYSIYYNCNAHKIAGNFIIIFHITFMNAAKLGL